VADTLYELAVAAVRRVPREISLTSMSTLSTLERTGSRRVTDLAAIEGITQPSMTVLVSGLERSDLVERRRDPADRRVVLVALTKAGSHYLETRRRVGTEGFAQLIEKLPPKDASALVAAAPALERLLYLEGEERRGRL
jgi:DNA-binding MarR family transcriptional regulator